MMSLFELNGSSWIDARRVRLDPDSLCVRRSEKRRKDPLKHFPNKVDGGLIMELGIAP